MSSKTRIIVLHMKEVVYTIAFLILAVLLGILIYFMFGPGKSQTTSAAGEGLYTPGVYRSSLTLNKNTFDVEVTVDQNNIQSIELVNLSESTTAMFPLVKPSLESLARRMVPSQNARPGTRMARAMTCIKSRAPLPRPMLSILNHRRLSSIRSTG